MQIFKNPNYDFVRWRWHALALSWLVILAGVVLTVVFSSLFEHIVDTLCF